MGHTIGGAGEQAAIVFKVGQVAFGPEKGKIEPVIAALRWIGVARGDAHDEFAAAGLCR